MQNNNDLKELGFAVVKWLDSNFLMGTGEIGYKAYTVILKRLKKDNPPLNWNCETHKVYPNQKGVLWIKDKNSQKLHLPQSVIFMDKVLCQESSWKIEFSIEDFIPSIKVNFGLDFYTRDAITGKTEKIFHDGENARLLNVNIESRTLTFQKSSYFHYLQTNLALDFKDPSIGSLREHIVQNQDGKIELLEKSILANVLGINGLVFSSDGYIIFQKRKDNVLVRPKELCSGFSGTVDKKDITDAIQIGGYLSNLPALREKEEELGVRGNEVKNRIFLGITRELIRGGTPEMFYAVDLNIDHNEILRRIPRDKEGYVKAVLWGHYAKSTINEDYVNGLKKDFWSLLDKLKEREKTIISVPFITNLALWFQKMCPSEVGTSDFPLR